MGGLYTDSVYKWTGVKFELIESSGRTSIGWKKVTTLWRPVVCADSEEPDPPLECPAGAKPAK
jgi:hypothetical protein